MKIRLICISDSDKHFAPPIEEYIKRMGKSLEIVKIKPIKSLPTQQIIAKETQLMLSALSHAPGYKILLSFRWMPQTTEQLVSLTEKHTALTCIIWGPFGLDETLIWPKVDYVLSLGKQTMPHGLVQLVWLEQLYRIQQIVAGKPYHY